MKRLLLLVAFSVGIYVYGQDTSDDPLYRYYSSTQKKFTFAFQPLQLFNWSWRSDFDMRLGNGPGWLQIGPAVYFAKNDKKTDDPRYYYEGNTYHYFDRQSYFVFRVPFSEMIGGGLDVNFKYFIDARRSFYHAVGLSYAHFKIDYWGMAWKDYIEDGLRYHAYALDYCTQHINRIGVNFFFGHQIPTRNAFLCDLFWGLAYRHSFSDDDKPSFLFSALQHPKNFLILFRTTPFVGHPFSATLLWSVCDLWDWQI